MNKGKKVVLEEKAGEVSKIWIIKALDYSKKEIGWCPEGNGEPLKDTEWGSM